MNSDARMIEAQAAQITKLNREISVIKGNLHTAEAKLAEIQLNAKFYSILQNAIMENPSLQAEWDNFMIMLRITVPEVEQEFKDAVRLCKPVIPGTFF